jgi:23S rRNA (guanosine2251-2'-O)-methyltransferase
MAKSRKSRNRGGPGPRRPRHAGTRHGGDRDGAGWIYGIHAVEAALANPARQCERLLVGDPELAEAAAAWAEANGRGTLVERVSRDDISAVLPAGAVHQNIALLANALPDPGLAEAIDRALATDRPRIVVLDQVTDPQNVGAIVRSAAAFGATALVVQDRHAPPVTGALAKAASGGLEAVDMVRETNLARAVEELKDRGFWCIGLAGEAERTVADARTAGPVALVLGAEGAGLRRLVRQACDALARIPQGDAVESLNVSNAAAVALYELTRPGATDG